MCLKLFTRWWISNGITQIIWWRFVEQSHEILIFCLLHTSLNSLSQFLEFSQWEGELYFWYNLYTRCFLRINLLFSGVIQGTSHFCLSDFWGTCFCNISSTLISNCVQVLLTVSVWLELIKVVWNSFASFLISSTAINIHFLNWYTLRGGCLLYLALTVTKAVTTLWSLIPGNTWTFSTRSGLVVNSKSRILFNLVGLRTHWWRPCSSRASSSSLFTLYPYCGDGLMVLLSQMISGKLKSSGVTPMGSEWANPRAPRLRGHPGAPLSLVF